MSSPSPALRPTNVRWLIILLLMGFTVLGQFNRYTLSVIGTERLIGPDKLSEAQMGLVYSTFLVVYTIGMLPGGWLIDRFGPKAALTGLGFGLGLCVMLTGVVGWLGLAVSSLLVPLLVIRGFAGAASVPLHPGAARAVARWVPWSGRSTANGLITAGALIGIALSYPGFGWLMDQLDWPLASVVCGGVLVAFTLAWIALATDDPAQHRWTNGAERALVSGTGNTPPGSRAGLRDLLGLLRNRSLVFLTLSYGAVGYVQYLFFYWMEYYFTKELKLPTSESRDATFIVTIAMAVGMTLGGVATDWLCRRLGVLWGSRGIAVVGMGLCAGFSLLGVSVANPNAVVWCFSLALGSLGLCEGIFWTTAPVLEPRNGGLAAALLNTGGNGVGLLAPVFTPLIGQHYGWNAAVVVACVVCGVGGLLWLGIQPTGSNAETWTLEGEEVQKNKGPV